MAARRHISTKTRVQLFADHSGRCHICGGKIDGIHERWDVEHVIPPELGGADDPLNWAPAHVACHKAKTKKDAAALRAAKQTESERHVRNLIRSGHLGHFRLGGRLLRIPASAVEEYERCQIQNSSLDGSRTDGSSHDGKTARGSDSALRRALAKRPSGPKRPSSSA